MEGPRNNLKVIKPHTGSSDSSENRDGKTKSKAFKFNIGSPEKAKSIYPTLPTDLNKGTISGQGASPGPFTVTNAPKFHKATSLHLETAISKPMPIPPSSPGSPSSSRKVTTIPMKRASPDASSSLNKRVKREHPLADSMRVNIPGPNLKDEPLSGLPSRFGSPSMSRATSPTKKTVTISTTTTTMTRHSEVSKSSKFDQMSIDRLLRLKSSRQEKALAQADLLMTRLKSKDDDDLDLLEDQYALLRKSVKEVEEAISRRGGANTASSSSSFSPISISSPRDCYDMPTKPLFASSTKDAFETSWTAPQRSPMKRLEAMTDTTLSNTSTSYQTPSTPQPSGGIHKPDVEDHSLWEGMDDLNHDDFRPQHSSSPRKKNNAIAAIDEFGDNLSFGKPTAEDVVETPQELHAKYSDDARYQEAVEKLQRVFKKKEFRHNQLEAIMATLSGKDVFVLMPTGGGKSLCYQLPAVCTTGATRGVTIVFSPLMALMEDQVQGLQGLNVDAAHANSAQSEAEARELYSRLRSQNSKPAVLYISPEKLDGSSAMRNIMSSLYERNEIARFVLDECHVFSTWGRSFRDSYRELSNLRINYPSVPIMALTATATDIIVKDIIFQLQMKDDCVRLKHSFNRPNLSYTVLHKPSNKALTQNIADWIKSTHPEAAGIIYCLSRENCSDLARELLEDHGISAHQFHGGMEKDEKRMVQRKWQNGEILVVVATVAFGMGIDKPDVRFVIHHSLPRDLSGYYQETGRAGRDGKPSECILYYAWRDITRFDRMLLMDEKLSEDERRRQRDEARKVARYCMLDIDCRRQYVLQHFGENFDREACKKGCDNCISGKTGTIHDLTNEAKEIVGLVGQFQHDRFTRNACVQIYRGSASKDLQTRWRCASRYNGKGSHWDHNTVERIVSTMILEGILQEYSERTGGSRYFCDYIKVGDAANALLQGRRRFEMQISGQKETKGKGGRKGKNKAVTVASVNRSAVEEITCFDDDDDLGKPIEHYAHARTNPGPSSSSTRVIATTRTTATVSSTTKVITIDGEDKADDPDEPYLINDLHASLCDLRSQIAKSRGKTEKEILTDECVELIALLAPKDLPAFQKVLFDTYDDKEFPKYVLEHYGMRFLDMCVKEVYGGSRGRLEKKVNTLNKAEMRSKFVFEEGGAVRAEKRRKGGIRGMDT